MVDLPCPVLKCNEIFNLPSARSLSIHSSIRMICDVRPVGRYESSVFLKKIDPAKELKHRTPRTAPLWRKYPRNWNTFTIYKYKMTGLYICEKDRAGLYTAVLVK